jgi:hypothetical protein
MALPGAVRADPQQQPEPLHDEDVVAMARAGFPDTTILLAIEANACEFDVSPGQLIKLRQQHVTDGVIQAMLAAETRRRGNSPHAAAGASAAGDPTIPASQAVPGHPTRAVFPIDFFAQQFIAKSGATVSQATVYVGRGRLRLETEHQTVLIDPASLTGYVWQADQPAKVIPRFEGIRGTQNQNGLSRYLLPVDPDQLCQEWINVECRRLGPESLQGRRAVKWQITEYFDDDSTGALFVWVDERLHLVSKRQAGQYTEELRNIIERRQPAGLFEPPARPPLEPNEPHPRQQSPAEDAAPVIPR